jgi:chaperonin GroEL
MSKIIKFDREAKEKLQAGIDKVNKAVSVTMGPFGRNVLIEKEHGQVVSTKDGVTVAKTITLEDPIENMAATVIKQAAQKTVDAAGDGTTTSTVLAHAIASQALEATSYASINATQVKRGIEEAVKQVIAELKILSTDITDEKQIKQIATLSANGDTEIGELVATAIDKVGRDGVVTVEESRSGETSLEVVEGLQFDRGYKSPYMVTDNNSMQAILNDALILLFDGRISTVKDLLPLLERVSQENKSLLIIAEDIDGEALSTLIVNKMRGILKVAAVKAPDFGERRTLILEDIATVTGGTVISPAKGMKLERFNMDWFGNARTVTVGKETTTIVDGKGNTEAIDVRIEELKSQIDQSNSPYEVERLQDRLAKMIGGVAIINVGGGTEIEMKERKDRIDDALQATKAALEEGILPGAGIALMHARTAISQAKVDGVDFNKGKQIILKACSAPFKQILNNAGVDHNEVLMNLRNTSNNMVPNIADETLVDAFESGIIDPTKVVRCALENAAAAAVTLLMTECVIHDKPTDKKKTDEVDMSGFGM